jgi:hypothetical protein
LVGIVDAPGHTKALGRRLSSHGSVRGYLDGCATV